MLTQANLENLLHARAVSNQNRLLFCLALSPLQPRQISALREIALTAGWTGAKKLNLSLYLKRARGLAILTPDGWKLTADGQEHVSVNSSGQRVARVPPVAEKLRQLLQKITSPDTRAFVEEAVKCFEGELYRSTVVFSWVGAVAVLYDHIVKALLPEFNAEASRRDRTWKAATTRDDLAKMKEFNFIQVLHSISVIGKSVKDELEAALKLRNGAGHPNSLKLGEQRAAAHVEALVLNVYSRF